MPAAIEKFLPGVYVNAGAGRLTYAAGSTTAGAVLYDNDTFIYSHHSTDPAGGKLLNAWDLVRIHKFGDQDADAAPGTPTASLPSWQQMRALAESDGPTAALLRQEAVDHAMEGFEPLPEEDTDPDKWQEKLDRTRRAHWPAPYRMRGSSSSTIRRSKAASGTTPSRNGCGARAPSRGATRCRSGTGRTRTTRACGGTLRRSTTQRSQQGRRRGSLTGGHHAKDPVREYLQGLVWDGTERLDRLFIDYLGAEDSSYTRAVTRKMFVAAVAGASAGVQVRPDLHPQRQAGHWQEPAAQPDGPGVVQRQHHQLRRKDARENLRGVWIVELGEMTAFSRSESEAAKQFLSQTEDRYRAAYGRRTVQYPRRCVFFGTSNSSDFLRDATGNRRYWPIDCSFERRTRVVHDDLTPAEVDQLWAEAVARFNAGEELILRDELQKAALAEQQAHTERDPWDGDILEFLEKPVPLDWANRTVDERVAWWENSPADPATATQQRTTICVNEIWRERSTAPERPPTGCSPSALQRC